MVKVTAKLRKSPPKLIGSNANELKTPFADAEFLRVTGNCDRVTEFCNHEQSRNQAGLEE